MPCRSDGYGDPSADIASARDKAAAVACECIKAMLTNDGYDLHDLPTGAEAWFKEHRARDKAEAVRLAEAKLRDIKREPELLVEDRKLRLKGYLPDASQRFVVEEAKKAWLVRTETAEFVLKKLKASDPMDLKHGLY